MYIFPPTLWNYHQWRDQIYSIQTQTHINSSRYDLLPILIPSKTYFSYFPNSTSLKSLPLLILSDFQLVGAHGPILERPRTPPLPLGKTVPVNPFRTTRHVKSGHNLYHLDALQICPPMLLHMLNTSCAFVEVRKLVTIM